MDPKLGPDPPQPQTPKIPGVLVIPTRAPEVTTTMDPPQLDSVFPPPGYKPMNLPRSKPGKPHLPASYPLPSASQVLMPATMPPTTFPPKIPPPNLLPRLENQDVKLAELDVEDMLAQAEKRDLGWQGVDMIVDGNFIEGNDDVEGESADEIGEGYKKALAYEALVNHAKERAPYVQLASERLQAVMQERNDMAFALPPFIQSPALNSGTYFRLPSAFGPNSHVRQGNSFNILNKALYPTHVEVNAETGEGLRDWLLTMGKRHEIRSRSLKSISLHDLTPHNKTFSNVLLGHFAVGESADRIEMYETDVPAYVVDPKTGVKNAAIETWLWIFIQKALVTISAKNLNTRPRNYMKAYPENSVPESPPLLPAPNFPQPIKRSYVVFACPLQHLTQYDEITESAPRNTHAQPSFPWQGGGSTPMGKKIYKRKDFDFAHQGSPLFEFKGATSLFGEAANAPPSPSSDGSPAPPNPSQKWQFLSVDDIGPFWPADAYAKYSGGHYAQIVDAWEETLDSDDLAKMSGSGSKWTRDPQSETPSPFRGLWWEAFYRGMYEDCQRWKKVRSAMGKGNLRVVVRWNEYESAGPRGLGHGKGIGRSGLGVN